MAGTTELPLAEACMSRVALCCTILVMTLPACHDLPVEPARGDAFDLSHTFAATRTAPTIACTRRWANAVDGLWGDPLAWSPAGIPLPDESVCISAAGSYRVDLAGVVLVGGLQIGGPGATVRFHVEVPLAAIALLFSGTIAVHEASRFELAISGLIALGPRGALVNDGVVEITGSTPLVTNLRLVNNGELILGARTTAVVHAFENTGTVTVNETSEIIPYGGGRIHFADGRVSGSADLRVGAEPLDTVIWSRTRLDPRWDDPTRAVVQLRHPDVLVIDTSAHGMLGVESADGDGTRIEGSIGSRARLVLSDTGAGFRFRNGHSAFVNRGRIDVATRASPDELRLDVARLVNRGTIDIRGAGAAILSGDTLENRGALNIGVALDVDADAVLHNHADITVEPGAWLRIGNGGTFHAAAGSTQRGALDLARGRLAGDGSVGTVRSTDGVIEPGSPYGTLNAASLFLDGGSTLLVDIAGLAAGEFDRLAVDGTLILDGTLRILPASPELAGQCGEILGIMSTTAGASGSFRTVINGRPSGAAAWRPHYEARAVRLAGYRPGAGVVVAPSALMLAEGEAAGSYAICLGTTAPIASVSVSRTSTTGQLEALPTTVFGVAQWALPLMLTAQATDDLVVEPPHADTIRHVVTSADPTYDGSNGRSLPVSIVDNDGSSDLALTLTHSPDAPFAGVDFATNWRITNAGASSATGATVVSTPLVGLEFVAATGASCSVDGSAIVTCTIGAIAVGAQVDFTLTLRGAIVGVHANTFTVNGQQADPLTTDNTVVHTQQIR